MCRPSGPRADLIDAHVWMRRRESRLNRLLTLDSVPPTNRSRKIAHHSRRRRAQMESVAASWDGTQSGLLAKQIQISEATLAKVGETSKAGLSIQTDISRLEVKQRQAVATEVIASGVRIDDDPWAN
jgi:hypothetical protein